MTSCDISSELASKHWIFSQGDDSLTLTDDFLDDSCFITWLANGDLLIEAPYNTDFIDNLKHDIPWQYRKWDPDALTWLIDKEYTDLAYDLCHDHFEFVDEDHEVPKSKE